MSADPETLRVYAARVADYTALTGADKPGGALRSFIGALPPGASVLDLGCGPGTDSGFMVQAGLRVEAIDATPEMIDAARAKGIDARLGTFDDLDAHELYDGVWASFSLLHAPRSAMPRHLAAIHRALRPGGLFHIGLKLGTGEERDSLGRFYTYYTADELMALLLATGFTVFDDRRTRDAGLSGVVADGILLTCRKDTADA